MEKFCQSCGETKLFSEFNKDSDKLHCISSYCRGCHSIYNQKKYEQNKQKVIKRTLARRYRLRTEKLQLEIATLERQRKEEEQKRIDAKPKKRASLKEYRNAVKNKPISVSDLVY